MAADRGTTLLVLLLMAWPAFFWSRESLPSREGPPAFFVEKREGIQIVLGAGFPRPGVHQFSDGVTPAAVMKMTGLSPAAGLPAADLSLRSGEALDVVRKGMEVVEFKRSWMPATHRMALGIPLRPDRMSGKDWEALPGIGPKLVQAIESDRHNNGEFRSLRDLERVRGIGPRRLQDWQRFFEQETTH